VVLLAPSLAHAQGNNYWGVVQGLNGPLPNQFIAVCLQPANITTTPCSTLATLYTDSTLTTPSTNPVQADNYGNFHFYIAPGKYTLQSYGPQILVPFVQRDVVIPCDPSNCVMSQLLVNGTITANAFIANSPSPAATGVVRLEHADGICWRNFLNNGDLCLTVNNSDAIQFPGGFGGGGGGTTLQINGASLASTVNLNNTTPAAGSHFLNVQWQYSSGNGSAEVPISGNGTAVGSVSGTLTSGDCAEFDANGNVVDAGAPCGASGSSLGGQTVCNQSMDITGIGSATPTTIITCSTTAPSSGCPCRAFISYTLGMQGTSSTEQGETWITDGTNVMLGTSGTADNQTSSGYKSVSRSGWSTVRYGNSSTNVFTLKAESDHTWNAKAVTFYQSLPSQIVVNYIPSN
jgi:hypothetical protein